MNPSKTAPITIVFDLDGTLVDTASDLIASINHVIGQIGLSPIDRAELNPIVGQGARAMLKKALERHGRSATDAELDSMIADFIAHYGNAMPGISRPFPFVLEAMDHLEQALGAQFAVCTNKTEALAKRLLKALEIDHRFKAICGGDTFAFKKPDPRHIIHTVIAAGGAAEHCIMVGDSAPDIDAANAGNIPAIGVPFGYTDIPVAELGATIVIDTYEKLTPDLVRQLLNVD